MNRKIVITGFFVGVINLIIGMLLSRVYNLMYPAIAKEYMNPAIFRPWSDPLMSLYFLYPFLLGIILAWIWDKVKKLVEGKTSYERAYKFALAYFIVAGIPGMFITYSTFQVSLSMVLSWLINGFVQAFVAGWIFVKKNP